MAYKLVTKGSVRTYMKTATSITEMQIMYRVEKSICLGYI